MLALWLGEFADLPVHTATARRAGGGVIALRLVVDTDAPAGDVARRVENATGLPSRDTIKVTTR